jgi:hypothetical protein
VYIIYLSIVASIAYLFNTTNYSFYSILTIYLLISIFLDLILIPLCVRRFHDRNKSGGLTIIVFLAPILGLYLLFAKGDDQTNKYGAPPKARLAFNDILGREDGKGNTTGTPHAPTDNSSTTQQNTTTKLTSDVKY